MFFNYNRTIQKNPLTKTKTTGGRKDPELLEIIKRKDRRMGKYGGASLTKQGRQVILFYHKP